MSCDAIRALLALSPETAGEVVIGNPNEIWPELQRLMSERDQAVELLRRICSNRDELWESGHDEIFENIEALLRGLEGE